MNPEWGESDSLHGKRWCKKQRQRDWAHDEKSDDVQGIVQEHRSNLFDARQRQLLETRLIGPLSMYLTAVLLFFFFLDWFYPSIIGCISLLFMRDLRTLTCIATLRAYHSHQQVSSSIENYLVKIRCLLFIPVQNYFVIELFFAKEWMNKQVEIRYDTFKEDLIAFLSSCPPLGLIGCQALIFCKMWERDCVHMHAILYTREQTAAICASFPSSTPSALDFQQLLSFLHSWILLNGVET